MSKQNHNEIQAQVMEKSQTIEELQRQLDEAKAQNKALKEQAGVTFKVSEKVQDDGRITATVSAYFPGLRFPCTQYATQWLTILDNADALRAFIESNRAKLTMEKPKRVAKDQGKVNVS